MLFDRVKSNRRRRRITPLMRRGQATQGGTTHLEFSSRQTANVHLAALKFSPAKNADALIVERFPAPKRIAYAQDRKSIIQISMRDHMQRAVCPLHRRAQSERGLIVS
jgi:hypothetical protein